MTKMFEKVYPVLYPERINKQVRIQGHFKEEIFTVVLKTKADREECRTIKITKDYFGDSDEFIYVLDDYNFYSSFYGIGSMDEDTRKVVHENYMNKELDLIWKAMEEVWEDPQVTKVEVQHIPATFNNEIIYQGWHNFNNIFPDEISEIEYTLSRERRARIFQLLTIYGEKLEIYEDVENEIINWAGTTIHKNRSPILYHNLRNQTYDIAILKNRLEFTNMQKAQQ